MVSRRQCSEQGQERIGEIVSEALLLLGVELSGELCWTRGNTEAGAQDDRGTKQE